jgi:K(+)-stimulated pyrophosphate-energized sodium pump
MGADIFESYSVTIIAAMILGGILFGINGAAFPLLAAAVGILASILGTTLVKVLPKETDPMAPLNRGMWLSALASVLFWYVLVTSIFPATIVLGGQPIDRLNLFYAAVVGMIATLAVGRITEYYTDAKYKPVQKIAQAATTGAGTNIISGLAYGMQSTVLSVLTVVLTIVLSYTLAGSYGIALAGMGMLAITALIVSMDTFGPIADNANGIGEMSGLDKKSRTVMDAMDSVGNTTKALTKGFAITSATVAAVALFATYSSEVRTIARSLGNDQLANHFALDISVPSVFVGMLLGGIVPFLFSSMTMNAVSVAAYGMIEEVRRQFKAHPGILKGTEDPDYARCVDISTASALSELRYPAILAVSSPILVGYVLGVEALGGFLGGAILSALFLAIFMCNAGGAWDNAKKYIEEGHLGGKGSEAHKAAVVGDTVGDPFKDTSGPALNPLIKILNVVALLFVGFFVANSLNIIKASAIVAGGTA